MEHAIASRSPLGSETSAGPSDLFMLKEDYLRLRDLAAHHPLAEELDKAIVVPEDRMPADVVTMNSRCVYVDEHSGERREVELVYPEEADPARGRISVLAPVGSALLGLAVGRTIEWVFPDERIHRLRVERVSPPFRHP